MTMNVDENGAVSLRICGTENIRRACDPGGNNRHTRSRRLEDSEGHSLVPRWQDKHIMAGKQVQNLAPWHIWNHLERVPAPRVKAVTHLIGLTPATRDRE